MVYVSEMLTRCKGGFIAARLNLYDEKICDGFKTLIDAI